MYVRMLYFGPSRVILFSSGLAQDKETTKPATVFGGGGGEGGGHDGRTALLSGIPCKA